MKLIIDRRAEWEIRGLVELTLRHVYITNTHVRDRSPQFTVQSCNYILNFTHQTQTSWCRKCFFRWHPNWKRWKVWGDMDTHSTNMQNKTLPRSLTSTAIYSHPTKLGLADYSSNASLNMTSSIVTHCHVTMSPSATCRCGFQPAEKRWCSGWHIIKLTVNNLQNSV